MVASIRCRPRLGHIRFLNSLPIYYGLVKNGFLHSLDLVNSTPTDLNQKLNAGQLDISAISSIEYLRHHRDLLLLPDLSISADGPVQSITLLSKAPLAELNGRAVALTSASATSHVLTRIILEQRYGTRPSYFISSSKLDDMLAAADAALLIGDAALHAQLAATDLLVYDLGREWKDLTGKIMVYAVWAVRREFAAQAIELVHELYLALQWSLRYGLEHIEEIAQVAAHWEPLSAQDLAAYFRGLHYSFGQSYQEGLLEFARRAQQLGELAEVPSLEFVRFGLS